jgi:hypothetical protein
MLIQLIVATVMGLLTVGIHLGGLTILVRVLRSQQARWSRLRFAAIPPVLCSFIGLMMIHGLEIWLFAFLYYLGSALPALDTALYFSIVTYASIGYGDVVLSGPWRIIGALEGVLGTVLLGGSTAFLVVVVTELKLFGRGRFVSDERTEIELTKDY